MENPVLLVKLFKLSDPILPFDEDNRTYLDTLDFGVIDQDEVKDYRECLDYVEPFVPLFLYEKYKTLFSCRREHYDEFSKYINEDEEPIHF